MALGAVLFVATVHDAFAHASFSFKPGNNVNNTLRLTFGETKEPAFVDEEHNMELTIVHTFTQLRVGNAHKAQTTIGSQAMFVDSYFYPISTIPSLTGCTNPVPNSPANCAAGAGFTDSRIHMNLSPISANDGGSAGQYKQATRQFYTEQGRTMYHVYGNLNYFNDIGIGPIPINVWTDGASVNRVSVMEGATNTTTVLSGSYGLANKTSAYWPDTATENTHPTNLRKAIGSIRDNTFDIWNVLEEITDAFRTVTGFGTVQDHVPRNSTNSGVPSSYTYP
jgi:hypothetical protein